MASLARRLTGRVEERDSYALPFQDYANLFNFNNVGYLVPGYSQTLTGNEEKPLPGDYAGIVEASYRSNGIVFALMMVRSLHFTEARFMYREIRRGRPGNLFSLPTLDILRTPWPNGTSGDLLARMIQDVDVAGNSYIARTSTGLFRLRPDWTTILLGSRSRNASFMPGDPDTEVVGYIYKPGGPGSQREPMLWPVEQVAHWSPYPDPQTFYRGMSWLTPVLREIVGDTQMTMHKNKFLEQGATVNMVVNFPTENLVLFQKQVAAFKGAHESYLNAYKTLFMMAGATATPVGADMQQMDFKQVQGAGETRLAAAAGVPAILVGFSEGLSGSSLNAGNYATARRRFADGTMRPLWRSAVGALATIVKVPNSAELWFDTRDIAFLKDDEKDAAEIRKSDSTTVVNLFNSGYDPDAIIDAVTSDDFTRLLGTHNGMLPVQQQASTDGSSSGTMDGSSSMGTA